MIRIMLVLLCFIIVTLGALEQSDLDFSLEREQYKILDKYRNSIEGRALAEDSDEAYLRSFLRYVSVNGDTSFILLCHRELYERYGDLASALAWIDIASGFAEVSINHYHQMADRIKKRFSDPADSLVIAYALSEIGDDMFLQSIPKLERYNHQIEQRAKWAIDAIAVERNDSLAIDLINRFENTFPLSQYRQIAYYYRLYHLSNRKDYASMLARMNEPGITHTYDYISSLFLMSPALRRNVEARPRPDDLLEAAAGLLKGLSDHTGMSDIVVLYERYDPDQWRNRLRLQQAKLDYYRLTARFGYWGDEDSLATIMRPGDRDLRRLRRMIDSIRMDNNDSGQMAELSYWTGRIYALSQGKGDLYAAARAFVTSLIHGSPRRRYDDAWQYFRRIHNRLRIKQEPMAWARKLMNYRGIVFEDMTTTAGLEGNRESRIALADYDNDGLSDILLNGRRLYKNHGDWSFAEVTEKAGLADLKANGGLFADFNLDGHLDFVTISHSDQRDGEQLMKNLGDERFASVNERAGDIDDRYPTEGAAWIDPNRSGYPDLYIANYERWQVRSAYPDFYWQNDKGYFHDLSAAIGIREPAYTDHPGQAGRGVAPADFDNDGIQEILVTNYRLNRNLCWKWTGEGYQDVAPLYNLHGKYKQGYYGHSIGADWGDYDNDGDLDLFIANLAHPRYIEISDVSLLLRNDGLMSRVIGADTLYYWQFTDVTRAAGITYDELHSDPLWFDADNDGDLDLFITSVYENDRSYLYHNNGDGTFSDITWLAGARVFNGWGNATADLDCDGRMDLVVGSGNGVKVLRNVTQTVNVSFAVKPVWEGGEIRLVTDHKLSGEFPNSPAFGTRIKITLRDRKGRTRTLIRELSSAKGTTSQSEPVLYFGLGRDRLIRYQKVTYENIPQPHPQPE